SAATRHDRRAGADREVQRARSLRRRAADPRDRLDRGPPGAVGRVVGLRIASSRTDLARSLFAGIAPQYDRMGRIMSFGQDGRWRRFLVSRIAPPEGGRVLDVATGTGLVAREIARRSAARIVGIDLSPEML